MEEKRTYTFTLQDVSKIVAEYMQREKGVLIYSGSKVAHDDNGLISFRLEY